MKNIFLSLLILTCINFANATNFVSNNDAENVIATIFFDSENKTIEINLDSKKEELESFYTILIKDKNGKTVMDFETNVSYNLINVSVFKKGTYTYEVRNGESKIQSGDFKIKGICNH